MGDVRQESAVMGGECRVHKGQSHARATQHPSRVGTWLPTLLTCEPQRETVILGPRVPAKRQIHTCVHTQACMYNQN